MINQIKIFLTRFRLARWLVNLKNGTLWMLRNGYQPRRFWDDWAERFTRQAYQRELHRSNRWLLERLRETRPSEVIEIGCGFGRNLRMFQDELGFPCRLYGLDISQKLLAKVRSDLGVDAQLVCGDVTKLPLAGRAFDTVITHGVLMHVPPGQVRQAIAELVRVTGRTLWLVEEQVRARGNRRGSFSINEYTFAHQYPALFAELGIPIAHSEYQGSAVALVLMRVDVA